MHASVNALSAASVALAVLGATQAAAADKSTKPRIAVLEFKAGTGGQSPAGLDVQELLWSDTQQRSGSWAKADGLSVSWDVAESPGSGRGAGKMHQEDISAAPDPGTARVSKVDAFTIKQATVEGEAPRANDRLRNAGPKDGWGSGGANETLTVGGNRTETAMTGGAKWKNIVLKRGVGAAAAGSVSVAVGDVTGNGSAASGQATGKRQHMPIRIRTYAAPLPRGSLLVQLGQPWPACAAGDRFNGAYLVVGTTHRYELAGATIVGCGTNAVLINYARLTPAGSPVR